MKKMKKKGRREIGELRPFTIEANNKIHGVLIK